jgi:hypothetical protein
MFDFSLPPATAVLPIDVHDFLAPNTSVNHFATSVISTYFVDDSPPPEPK